MSYPNHITTNYQSSQIDLFMGNTYTPNTNWYTWTKPLSKTMAYILAVGCGGDGGISTNSSGGVAGWGGGFSVTFTPLYLLPDTLYINIGLSGTDSVTAANNPSTVVSVNTSVSGVNVISIGTAGAPGLSIVSPTVSTMTSGWFMNLGATANITAGSALTNIGIGGGAAGATSANPGTSPATPVLGTSGFLYTAPTVGAGTTTTTVAENGYNGFEQLPNNCKEYLSSIISFFPVGGIGGGGMHGGATGAALQQTYGGKGMPGCGGGGSGGIAAGGTATTVIGRGGPGYCLIITW